MSSHAGKTAIFDFLKQGFHLPLFFVFFHYFWSFFWRSRGLFWHPCGAFVVSFGVLVSFFWEPLLRVGCLWALSATFCGAFGSSRLSVGSGIAPGLFFGLFSGLVPCFFDCFSFVSVAEDHCSRQHSFETLSLQPSIFQRASRSLAKTGYPT